MKILVNILFVIILLYVDNVAAQNKVTVSGYISDLASGETLIGANIYVIELQKGSSANVYGFYSLSLPPGSYTLQYSYLGFITQEVKIDLKSNIKHDIELVAVASQLAEVVINSEAPNSNVSTNEMSVNKLDISTIQKMPSLLGEVEILRSIQLLPGVSSVGEGASGFNVRGGSIDQNLVLLDEAPVYNSSHLFGFFSVFNPDAVKDVKLYKGGIPARYGGRLSSILDVRMKEGNKKKLALKGGIGAIFSRLSVEAPLIKDKASFIVAGRRSYIDILAQPFLNEDIKGSALNFYDLTFKTNYNINEKNTIFVSAYLGRDNFSFGDEAGFNWGNATTTLRWNHLFSDKLFFNLTAYYSDYDYQINFGSESNNKFNWDASIKNYSIEPEFTLFLTPGNLIRFGILGIIYEFEPANAVGISEGETTDLTLPKKYAIESSIFIENEIDLGDRISLNYGLRYSMFNYTGKGRSFEFVDALAGERRPVSSFREHNQWESIATYSNLEPRLSLKYQLNDQQSFKLSYNKMSQYIHLISNTTAATPVDIWTPSTNNIKPQTAHQVAIGYFQNFKDDKYEMSTELYYKKMNNLVDYIDGADLLINELLEGDLLEGRGRAYGIELMFRKTEGRFSGWVSYTLARTERQVAGINNDKWYASRFDQLHNLSLTAFYDISKRLSISANFALISGTPTTFPTTRFEQQGYIIPDNAFGVRNNVRIPSYHRLDLSATLQGKKNDQRRWQSEWVFSIYNVYSKRNPFSIFTRLGENGVTEAVRLSVVGNFIPSVSYNFKF
ncbi:MAG: TonB-dependent receptor [Saprospiraceae bacterium]